MNDPEDLPTTDELLTEIRGLASMMFVQENGEIEAWMETQKGDSEDLKTIRATFVDMFDFGVAYGVSATIEVLQRLGIIPRIRPDTENEKE